MNLFGEDEIKELAIIRNEFPKPKGGRYGKDIKRIDVGVLCTLGKKDDKEKFIPLDEEQKNLNTIIIDIEMQIEVGFVKKEDYSKRFIDYANQIYAREKVSKVYVIALVLSPKNLSRIKSNSSKTSFTEKSIPKFSTIKEYDLMTIIKIDLNYCLKLLEDNKGIWILNSKNILNKDGEEWIKYLTIPLWCDKSDNGCYQFPNISEDNFVANKYVYQALTLLSNKNSDGYEKYDEESSLFEKDKKICEINDKLLEKDEELESLKKKYNKMKEKMTKLKKKYISSKRKSSGNQKKNIKSSNTNKKKYKYPKDEIIEENDESEGEVEKGEEEEENERNEEEEEKEGEESRDSDYYPDKNDLEEEEKKDEDKDDDNNKKKDEDYYMDLE